MTETRHPHARIVVVDDEPANVELLSRALQMAGYRDVVVSTDATATVDLVRQVRPDVLLLDLHMPGRDGFAIMGALGVPGSRDHGLPILVLTADIADEARERALRLGATDFLTKPLQLVEVVNRMENLLDAHFLRKAVATPRPEDDAADDDGAGLARAVTDAGRVAAAVDADRERIAKAIHDGPMQLLSSAALVLQLAERKVEDPAVAEELRASSERIRRAADELRALVFPPESPVPPDTGDTPSGTASPGGAASGGSGGSGATGPAGARDERG